MRGDPRRRLGSLGEQLAAKHLTGAGYELVDRNFRTRFGEIDIVATGGDSLVFCEVKTRLLGGVRGPAAPLDAIGPSKRRRVRRMAAEWLGSEVAAGARARPANLRFDAIGVTLDASGRLLALEHVEDAF